MNMLLKRISAILLGLAFLAAAWMAFSAFSHGQLAGCEKGGCSAVMASRFAWFFGVPVSFLGALVYGAMLFAVWRGWHKIAAMGAWGIVFAALWFVGVQVFVLHVFCPWCCALHAIASAAAWVFIARQGAAKISATKRCALSFSGVAIFALLQWLAPAPASSQKIDPLALSLTPDGKKVVLAGGAVSFDPKSLPKLLSLYQEKNGKKIATLPTYIPGQAGEPILFIHDWTCLHCRELHKKRASLPEVNRIVMLPAWRDALPFIKDVDGASSSKLFIKEQDAPTTSMSENLGRLSGAEIDDFFDSNCFPQHYTQYDKKHMPKEAAEEVARRSDSRRDERRRALIPGSRSKQHRAFALAAALHRKCLREAGRWHVLAKGFPRQGQFMS